jgi:glutathione S-transferase
LAGRQGSQSVPGQVRVLPPFLARKHLPSRLAKLREIDGLYAGKDWLFDKFSVTDPYAFVLYSWGVRRELPMQEMKNYTAFKDRMLRRPAVQRVVEDEKIKV